MGTECVIRVPFLIIVCDVDRTRGGNNKPGGTLPLGRAP